MLPRDRQTTNKALTFRSKKKNKYQEEIILRSEFTVQSFLNLVILGGVIHKNYVRKEQQNHLACYHVSYTNILVTQ